VHEGGKMIKSANGISGVLCQGYGGRYFFRVYNENGFKDYKLRHSDLSITINDEDAFLYENDEHAYIDHAPSTMGNESSE
jgi:hypothetical protein